MKNRVGLILLVLISVGLAIGLIWSQQRAADLQSRTADSISYFSNQWAQTDAILGQQRQVNTLLEHDLNSQRDAYQNLTNAYSEVAANLIKSEAELKSAQEELDRRGTRIVDLETQNQVLDRRAIDLTTAITNLNEQIDDTRRKLAASEGDKAFLQGELERLIVEKAELERQFNDLTVLRAQVAKLKEELNISRRLEWIRQGLFARADQRGAEQLMQKAGLATNRLPQEPSYDLNVEVSADGSIRVVPRTADQPKGSGQTNSPTVQ